MYNTYLFWQKKFWIALGREKMQRSFSVTLNTKVAVSSSPTLRMPCVLPTTRAAEPPPLPALRATLQLQLEKPTLPGQAHQRSLTRWGQSQQLHFLFPSFNHTPLHWGYQNGETARHPLRMNYKTRHFFHRHFDDQLTFSTRDTTDLQHLFA